MNRIFAVFAYLAIAALAACGGAAAPAPPGAATASAGAAASDPPLAELRIDYATYSPPSLVLKKQGWAEQALPGTAIKWVYSAGSSNALNFLQGNAVDFGSTAGSAALLSRANGNPIKAVYIYEQPEWTALVVAKGSAANDIKDLKGKKIAAQKGTDPYFFLLRTLDRAGMKQADIQYVNLPHADGRTAVERGQVDAWAGLDPDKAADILADEAKLPLDVAKRELVERMSFKASGIPGEEHAAVLRAVIPIIAAEQLANPGADVEKSVKDLIDGSYAKAAIK